MLAWLALAGAILSEVSATLSLRQSVTSGRAWLVPVAVGYLLAFVLMSVSLGHGMPLGVAYGLWVAAGVALIALLGRVLFADPLTRTMLLGIGLVIAGVLCIELGAAH